MEMIPMGVADAITKEYMRGSKVFSDAFNYFIYGGEQVVDPEFLHELDTTEIGIPCRIWIMMRHITKTPIYVPEGKGEINVCEAVKDMINESRLEGRAEGKAEGKIQMLKELVKDGTLSVVSAAAKVNMTAEQFKKELDKEV